MAAMHPTCPELEPLIARVNAARDARTPLAIRGGGSKTFYGEVERGEVLDTRILSGVSSYEPTELVVTARCGTPLAELEALLATHGQCLPFEPPHFGGGATVGGMVAAGLTGPARAAAGSVRDHVLGTTLLTGRGEVLSFGGQVMKNVAGYDVSRVLAGSMGILGVILEVSLKVLPIAPATLTLRLDMDEAAALARLNTWGGQPLPLNASTWSQGVLHLRLSGALAAVQAAHRLIGGEPVEPEQASALWQGWRNHHAPFFAQAHAALEHGAALWRLSVPPSAPPLALAGAQLIEWGGAQRWLSSTAPAAAIRAASTRVGGHASLFRAHDKSAGVLTPLPAALERIHRGLKSAFDPDAILNPGRLYPGL